MEPVENAGRRGQCPVCDRTVRLTPAQGRIKTHVTRGERCSGMGSAPVPGSVVPPSASPQPAGSFAPAGRPLAPADQGEPGPPSDPVPAPRRRAGRRPAGLVLFGGVAAGLVFLGSADPPRGTVEEADRSSAPAPATREFQGYTRAPERQAVPATDDVHGLPVTTVEATFLETIHDTGLSRYGSDAQQTTLARSACAALDGGSTPAAVMGVLVDGGYSDAEAGAFFGIAVASFCLEHRTW